MYNINSLDINDVNKYKEEENKYKKRIITSIVFGGVSLLSTIIYDIGIIVGNNKIDLIEIPAVVFLVVLTALAAKYAKHNINQLKALREQYVVAKCNDGEEVLVINPPITK